MKKTVLLLISGLMALALTGCSLFTSGFGKDAESARTIEISDDMIHEVPTDLEYANEYIYYAPEISDDSKSLYEEKYDTTLEKDFFILYSDKDDAPLRAYYYLVLGDEAGAEKVKEYLEQNGDYEITVNGKNICYIQNQESLNTTIDSLIAMSFMTEKTGRAYVDMYCGMDKLTEYVPE
ncbi:MAG TPA: hypothetical protein DF613_09385 [Lachnospiraceae bacterium]|nr:hypothetical protein [Lachnospiraceae bacterium]